MGKREFALLIAGVVILGVVVFRQAQIDAWRTNPTRVVALRRLAPRFELADHRRNLVKLDGLLGRHRIVLVFFDAELGVDGDARTRPLIDHFETIKDAGIHVLAVSTATPFANGEAAKRLGKELPFSVMTDIDLRNPAPHPTHTLWGRVDETGEPIPGIFLIERDGTTIVDPTGIPIPIEDEEAAISQLVQGEWPK